MVFEPRAEVGDQGAGAGGPLSLAPARGSMRSTKYRAFEALVSGFFLFS